MLVLAALAGCGLAGMCRAQDNVVCRAGSGNFVAEFSRGRGGVNVHVGATKVGGLGTRSCEATLGWGEQTLVVASGDWLVDLDILGADLGMGVPVAAFQVKKSEGECCATYLIYSLQKPQRLLRTVRGGSAYRASDSDLDTRVEIWTDDAAAVDGLEDISASELDFAPPVVLRFDHGQLTDASSEFQPYFDRLIANQKERLNAADLKDFKSSDGKLAPGSTLSPEGRHRLRRAKIGVLEIVWGYLYSGREREAWATLTDMWPATDVERIRASIKQAHERGIRAQTDGAATALRHKKRATIYDVTRTEADESEIVSPMPIQMWRPTPGPEQILPSSGETVLTLVIDSAGKVRSVSPSANSSAVDAELVKAAMEWKFIPALRGGHAVASRTQLAVSLKR